MYRVRSEISSRQLLCSATTNSQHSLRRPEKWLCLVYACTTTSLLALYSSTALGNEHWQAVSPSVSHTPNTAVASTAWQEAGSQSIAVPSLPDSFPDKADNRIAPAVSELIEFDNAEKLRALPSLPISHTNTINLDLFVGQVSVLGQVDVHRVAVGNGGIIRAQVLDTGELLVIAASPGSSSLRLWNRDKTQTDYNIRVAQADPETRVRKERMVRMRVRMVEFRKSALGRLGIDWNDSVTGPVLSAVTESSNNQLLRPVADGFDALAGSSAAISTYFGIASNITSKINLMAQNGDAVTLAEPVLSAMNGGQASFLAGGEVPYPTVGENGQTQVAFKEYGVKLDVAPLIDGAGNVRTRIETEISQLDSSVSVQGTPGLLTRRAQTEITVHSGETIVISGLLSATSGGDTNRVPGLGRLPLVGRFFRSTSERNSVNELVIFVTPEVVEADQPMINAREKRYLNASDTRVEQVRRQLRLLE